MLEDLSHGLTKVLLCWPCQDQASELPSDSVENLIYVQSILSLLKLGLNDTKCYRGQQHN